jgi:tripartite-type tricarboxylate transporter receptor subunit TctC
MAAVAKASPDGYTLALMPIGNAAVNPWLFADLPYDPVKDFEPVTQIATVENVLVVGAGQPFATLADLVARGTRGAVALTYATPGAGSLAHLAAELFAKGAGLQIRHVPYRGVSPALTDVLRGEVTMIFAQLSTAKALDRRRPAAGARDRERRAQRRPAGGADGRRGGGLPGFEAVSWYALMAPAGTPAAIVLKLQREVARIVHLPDVKAAMEAQGAKPVGGTPGELAEAHRRRYGALGRDRPRGEHQGELRLAEVGAERPARKTRRGRAAGGSNQAVVAERPRDLDRSLARRPRKVNRSLAFTLLRKPNRGGRGAPGTLDRGARIWLRPVNQAVPILTP